MDRMIDLSFPMENSQASFPGDPEIRIEASATLASEGFNLTRMSLSAHHGTHLDAPFHCLEGGATLDRIPLERCVGPAVLVDLAPGGELAPGTKITEDLLRLQADAFRPGGRVLIRTGWDRRHGSPEYYGGFPALTAGAARWIAAQGIGLLGLDTPSPDAGTTGGPGCPDPLECHRILLGEREPMVIVECLRNLHLLPRQFHFIGLPLNITGRDGSPVRAVAVVKT